MSNDNPIDQMQAYASLYRKKAAIILALNGGMDKDGKNMHFNYKFIKADDVKHEVGALFAQYGIALQMSKHESRILIVSIATKDGPKETAFMEVDYLVSLCDCDTGAVETSGAAGLALFTPGDDKVINKCGTAALKYFLMNTFLIAEKDEDDPDADKGKSAQGGKRNERTNTPAPPAPKPAQTPVSNTGTIIAAVLPEYQPFMKPDHFDAMKSSLRNAYQRGDLIFGNEAIARGHIEQLYSTTIDMKAKRAAAKETN